MNLKEWADYLRQKDRHFVISLNVYTEVADTIDELQAQRDALLQAAKAAEQIIMDHIDVLVCDHGCTEAGVVASDP